MPGMENIGRVIAVMGAMLVVLGLILMAGGKLPFLGKLPGDIRIEREGFSCSFPLVTSLLVSLILTVILNVLLRLLRK